MKNTNIFRTLNLQKVSLILMLPLFTAISFGQEHENVNIIAADSTWGKEIFKFPIRFAKNINYKGVEEARFPPKGWNIEEHQNFWSYVFAWDINLNRKIKESELELDLEKYFDGLVGVDYNKEREQYKAESIIVKVEDSDTSSIFKGKINTYDGFTTNKAITLYVLIESNYCMIEKKSVILFRFSPKSFEHAVWKTLKEVKLNTNVCNH